jgi:hypothetical protein
LAAFLGVDPPEVQITGDVNEAQTRYMGQSSEACAKLAFFHIGPNVDIELIEPDKNPNSIWRYDLDTKGEGFHHITFFI